MIPTKFTDEEAEAANEEYGFNCGPAALAAICGLRPEQVRLAIPDFEKKGYTSPSMMYAALRNVGAKYHDAESRKDGQKIVAKWPNYGLARIQWEGPWMAEGVPIGARYKITHWVGAETTETGVRIFDINSLGYLHSRDGDGWTSLEDWQCVIVPYLTENIKRATGGWHITHSIEVTV